MGMTYTQFWDEAPYLTVVYREAYRIKRKVNNEEAWLQGLYIYDAVGTALYNAFKKRGEKKQSYIEKPVDIFPLTEDEKKQREAEENERIQRAMEEMIAKQQARKKAKKGEQ